MAEYNYKEPEINVPVQTPVVGDKPANTKEPERKKTVVKVVSEDKKPKAKMKPKDIPFILLLTVLAVIFIAPILLVLMNSFKGKLYVGTEPFAFPTAESFYGLNNYIEGIQKIGFFESFFTSVFITVFAVLLIVLCTSMCAWFIVRVKAWYTKVLYLLCAFSMIVPFQMVMYPMTQVAATLKLNNPVGIIFVYLGFGAGLAVFMFVGFIKSVPLEIEEAAMIDGCGPVRTYFLVVFPLLKPTAITVAILDAMWIWNDYLLPYLLLNTSETKTLPMAIQYLRGGYGSIDMANMMAMIVLSIIPIVIFYLVCQKYIIKGIVAGAVKG